MEHLQGIRIPLLPMVAVNNRVSFPPPPQHISFPRKELRALSLTHATVPNRHSLQRIQVASLIAQSCRIHTALRPMVAVNNRASFRPPQHQVFINFRGKELRHGFVSHLVDALKRKGINFFIDEHEEMGTDLKNLFVRIKESKIALTIFSQRYAESRWCLDELAKINKRARTGKLHLIPVFYKVEPYYVKNQTGGFGDRFLELAKNYDCCQIKNWKQALKSVSNKKGMVLDDNRSECDFIKDIVKEIEKALMGVDQYA